MGSVRAAEQGIASGTNNALREVGGALGIAALGSIFSAQGGYGSASLFVDGLVPALWVGAGVLTVGVVSAALYPKLRAGGGATPVAAGEPSAHELHSAT
jgi:hypothetical protein